MSDIKDRALIVAIRDMIAYYLDLQDRDDPFFKAEDLYYELCGNLADIERDYDTAENSEVILLAYGYIDTLKVAKADSIITSMKAMKTSLDANLTAVDVPS